MRGLRTLLAGYSGRLWSSTSECGVPERLHVRGCGCRAGGDLVLSMVVADYPCRDGTPLVSLAGLPQGNFLLWIDRDSVTARAADGQYFRISPVSRP